MRSWSKVAYRRTRKWLVVVALKLARDKARQIARAWLLLLPDRGFGSIIMVQLISQPSVGHHGVLRRRTDPPLQCWANQENHRRQPMPRSLRLMISHHESSRILIIGPRARKIQPRDRLTHRVGNA